MGERISHAQFLGNFKDNKKSPANVLAGDQ